MPDPFRSSHAERLPSAIRVHVLGAGPVGLAVAALLQTNDRFSVHLYEKRREYTRTRMVQLAPYLVADSIESYCADYIDGESVGAIFEPEELEEGLAVRRSISPDLAELLRGWTLGFCPLNHIERSLSDLIDARQAHPVQRVAGVVTTEDLAEMLQPEDVLIDCTGTNSLLRDRLTPGEAEDAAANTYKLRLEYALVVTFLYSQAYDCNEYCKYYKNIENAYYKFIPAVNRTYYDGHVTHITGIVNIPAEDYDRMPPRCDGQWLRDNFSPVAQSMDRFITKIRTETNGTIVGDLEVVRIPLNLYRARNATSLQFR
jgi:flavin-dependent dehydrogenase